MKTLLLATAASLVFVVPAGATTLDFSGNICGGGTSCTDYEPLDQSYGDTGLVDVQYRYDSTGVADAANSVQHWASNYNNLTDVIFGTPGTNSASVFFAPVSGYQVTLNSFNIGAWFNRIGAASSYTIFDGLGATLYSSGAISVGLAGNIANFYSVGLSSANGIGIKWGPDSYNVGLDNIDFTVSAVRGAVPEPASWAMMIGGLALAGAAMRRRKATVSFA